MPGMTETSFPTLAADILAGILDRDPVEATYLGDHTRDGSLPDPAPAATAARQARTAAFSPKVAPLS